MTRTLEGQKKFAVFQVWKATKRGILIPPKECAKCQREPGFGSRGQRLIQAHHHNGYDDDHILDVVWLCPSCHKIEDDSFGWTEERKAKQSALKKGRPLNLSDEQRAERAERCKAKKPWGARWGKK